MGWFELLRRSTHPHYKCAALRAPLQGGDFHCTKQGRESESPTFIRGGWGGNPGSRAKTLNVLIAMLGLLYKHRDIGHRDCNRGSKLRHHRRDNAPYLRARTRSRKSSNL
jgi:hypothetical protein